jgi:hypothetical protein
MVNVESNVARLVGHTFVFSLKKLDETLAVDKLTILQMETRLARLADTPESVIAAFESVENDGSEVTEAETPKLSQNGGTTPCGTFKRSAQASSDENVKMTIHEILYNEKEKVVAPHNLVYEAESDEESRRKFIPGNRIHAQHQGKWYDAIVLARNDRRGLVFVRTITMGKLSWFPLRTTRIRRIAAFQLNVESLEEGCFD